MFVRLKDGRKGRPANGPMPRRRAHGDLLDVIRESCGLVDFKHVAEEARRSSRCRIPNRRPDAGRQNLHQRRIARSGAAALAMSQPIGGTLVEAFCADAALRLCTKPGASLPSALLLSAGRA
jgi:hypothetical protein